MEEKTSAIILVAGNSTRFGQKINKNLVEINKKPVVEYSLEAFEKNQLVDDILVVVKKKEQEKIQEIVQNANLTKPVRIVLGGNSRQESVYHAITATDATIVIIHDGARCMITQDYITRSIQAMKKYEGTSIAVKSKDTIKLTDEEGIVESTTLRKNTWIIQTPQCFRRETLVKGHKMVGQDDTITDDCMILERMGKKVKLLEGDYTNIKITTKEDIELAKRFLL